MGAEVTVLSDGVPTEPSLFAQAGVQRKVHDVCADIRDAGAVQHAPADARPEVVLQVAAQPLVGPSFAQPRLSYEGNVMGTVTVLETVRATSKGASDLVTTAWRRSSFSFPDGPRPVSADRADKDMRAVSLGRLAAFEEDAR